MQWWQHVPCYSVQMCSAQSRGAPPVLLARAAVGVLSCFPPLPPQPQSPRHHCHHWKRYHRQQEPPDAPQLGLMPRWDRWALRELELARLELKLGLLVMAMVSFWSAWARSFPPPWLWRAWLRHWPVSGSAYVVLRATERSLRVCFPPALRRGTWHTTRRRRDTQFSTRKRFTQDDTTHVGA